MQYTYTSNGTYTMSVRDPTSISYYERVLGWLSVFSTYSRNSITESDSINMSSLSMVTSLLGQGATITDCVTKCSNNGMCQIVTAGTYGCSCNIDITGRTCNVDKRPCSSAPCLNNGTCSEIQVNNVYQFTCLCKESFSGDRCQLFDLDGACTNASCNNSICSIDSATSKASCKRFLMYSGVRCEIESDQMKSIKSTISAASIIAIISILVFYAIFVVLDLIEYFFIKTCNGQSEAHEKASHV
jgi:hypothetical protein